MKSILQSSLFLFAFLLATLTNANAQSTPTFIGLQPVKVNKVEIDPMLPDPNVPNEYAGWSYAWGDEFNYTGKPDPAMWSYE